MSSEYDLAGLPRPDHKIDHEAGELTANITVYLTTTYVWYDADHGDALMREA